MTTTGKVGGDFLCHFIVAPDSPTTHLKASRLIVSTTTSRTMSCAFQEGRVEAVTYELAASKQAAGDAQNEVERVHASDENKHF